jgi:hypothetical protein
MAFISNNIESEGYLTANTITATSITSPAFIGGGAGLTGIVSANTVVTNAALTGYITSVGNTTYLSASTGTGAFVMQTSPTLTTPNIGVAIVGI